MPNKNELLGQLIKRARKEAGYSQQQLSSILGWLDPKDPTHRSSRLSNYETGAREPDLETLIAISNATNRPIEFFLRAIEKKTDSVVRIQTGAGKTRATADAISELIGDNSQPSYREPVLLQPLQGEQSPAKSGFYVSRSWIESRGYKYRQIRQFVYHSSNMEPIIQSGSTILVNTDDKMLRNGKFSLFKFHDEYQIRQTNLLATGDIELDNARLDFKDERIPNERLNTLNVIGRVIATFNEF